MPPRLAAVAVGVGLFDMVGNACYVLATQAGRLDVAATLSSLYPVTTILLAVAFLGERVTRSHAVGIAAAVAAIVLISAGSAAPFGGTARPDEAISSPSAPPSASPNASPAVLISRDLQPGTDWRLLLDAPNTGNPGVEAAADEVSLGQIWTSIGHSDVVTVDLARELVIFLNPIVSVDCHALKLKALHFDAQQVLLYGSFEAPPMAAECSDAAGSHLFVVAVSRNALPQGPLKIRVMEDFQLCADCGRSKEQTEIDLSAGSTP
jgi:hypothetical protein